MGGINYSRLQKLTESYRLDGTDHWDCDGNSIELEMGLFLYSLVRKNQPKVIVETGTWKGVSASFMACALADIWESYTHRPKGHLYTVGDDKYQNIPCALQIWKNLGIEEYIHHTVGLSTELRVLNPPVDMYFLDAGHEYDEIMDEWNHLKQFAGEHGILLGHDTSLQPYTRKATFDIAKTLPGDVQVMELPHMRGTIMIKW